MTQVILMRRGSEIGRPTLILVPRVGDTLDSEFATDRKYSHDFKVEKVFHSPKKGVIVEVE